jgi:hypothetical protein
MSIAPNKHEKWTLVPTGHPGDLSIYVIPHDEGLPETFDEHGQQEWWESVVVVPEARAVAAEAERDALRETLEDAEEFIETVTGWSGTDPDEADELLAEIRAALAASVSKDK